MVVAAYFPGSIHFFGVNRVILHTIAWFVYVYVTCWCVRDEASPRFVCEEPKLHSRLVRRMLCLEFTDEPSLGSSRELYPSGKHLDLPKNNCER